MVAVVVVEFLGETLLKGGCVCAVIGLAWLYVPVGCGREIGGEIEEGGGEEKRGGDNPIVL